MVVESSKIGQYRIAVASGESQNADNCLVLETHPTLPRFGTDRSRNLIVWLRPKPRCATFVDSVSRGGTLAVFSNGRLS